MKNKKPKISVIMSVYNAKLYLSQAIESILNQTCQDFELIIINDVSSDDSWRIIENYSRKDARIRIFRNPRHMGVSRSLKKGIEYARGKFIAFMDADDISLPYRLEKQINHLEKHGETVAVGGQCILINKNNDIIGKKVFPENFDDIYRYIYRFDPVQQPTLMIKKKFLPENFEYFGNGMDISEELELNFKLFIYGKVENLSSDILMYRMHNSNFHLQNIKKTFILTLYARIKAVIKYGYKPDLSGILITFMQIFIVLILPKEITLSIYRKMRNIPAKQNLQLITTSNNLLAIESN